MKIITSQNAAQTADLQISADDLIFLKKWRGISEEARYCVEKTLNVMYEKYPIVKAPHLRLVTG